VGHISPNKGVHLLIGAFNLVSKKIPSARLVIVGKHHYSNYSRDLAKISDSSIIFVGDVLDDDLPSYYAACNVYATASHWEGFDMPLAEAQACGKPVVAFDIGSHPEVVKAGVPGKLVAEGDTNAMAEAILGFIKLPIGEEG
jgi:1,2-diacylglycerol 3-alpha-glucosyltransferase